MKQHTRSGILHGGALLAGLLAHGYAAAQSAPAPAAPAPATPESKLPAPLPDAMPSEHVGEVIIGHDGNRCPTMPKGAIPAPWGTHVRNWQNAQTSKAEQDDFVFYKHEWYLGGKELGPYGRYHLNEVAKRLRKVPLPVIIQPTFDRDLNEARRQLVVQYLKMNEISDAELRVLVAFPEAEGLFGDEAERIFLQATGGQGGGRGAGVGLGGLTPFTGLRGGAPGISGFSSGGAGGIGVGGFRGF